MNTINYEAFNEYMEDHFAEEAVVEIDGVEVNVKRHLSIEDVIDFVEYVVKNCFQDDEYHPEIKDFLIRTQIVSRYTNVELPDDLEDKYVFLYRSSIVGKVVENVNKNELNSIINSIDYRIENMREVSFGEYKKKMDIIYDGIMSMIKQAESIYSGITPEAAESLIKAVSAGEDGFVDQAALVRAMSELRKEVDDR